MNPFVESYSLKIETGRGCCKLFPVELLDNMSPCHDSMGLLCNHVHRRYSISFSDFTQLGLIVSPAKTLLYEAVPSLQVLPANLLFTRPVVDCFLLSSFCILSLNFLGSASI